jgi:hypothetical protein
LIAYRMALGEPLASGRRLRDFGVAGAYLVAPAVWSTFPYLLAQREAGLKRSLTDEWIPPVQNFFASPSTFHQYVQSVAWPEPVNTAANAFLFPGFVPLLLVLTLCVPRATSNRTPAPTVARGHAVGFYALLAVFGALIFSRPPVGLWPLVYWLPGFNFIRVPTRFIVLVLLALSVLTAAAFERWSANWSPRRRTIAAVALAVLILAEYSSLPFNGLPYQLTIPAADRWLGILTPPLVIAELPVPSSGNLGALERQQTRSMLHSTAHWQKTIHGYSGIRRPLHDQLYRDLASFPDEQSLRALRRVGVTHVVIHGGDYTLEEWPELDSRLAQSRDLQLERTDGKDRVYSLKPPP